MLIRYLSGEASPEEVRQVKAWVEANEQTRALFEQYALLWQKSAGLKEATLFDAEKDWQEVKTQINAAKTKQPGDHRPVIRSLSHQFIKIAAMLVFTISLGWLAYSLSHKIGAAKEIVASANTQPVQLTLPDGTKVILNKHSSLTYHKDFDGQTRKVRLKGEAFFDVVKNPQKPFLISTGNTQTEVLGTSFNIYQNDQRVVLSVVTGIVAFYDGRNEQKVTVTAGQQADYLDGSIHKTITQNPNFLSWRTGVLIFRNTPLAQVLSDLNKHYQQQLVLETNNLATCTLTSTFKGQTFEQVLEELQLVLPVSISRKDKKTIISGAGCLSSK